MAPQAGSLRVDTPRVLVQADCRLCDFPHIPGTTANVPSTSAGPARRHDPPPRPSSHPSASPTPQRPAARASPRSAARHQALTSKRSPSRGKMCIGLPVRLSRRPNIPPASSAASPPRLVGLPVELPQLLDLLRDPVIGRIDCIRKPFFKFFL